MKNRTLLWIVIGWVIVVFHMYYNPPGIAVAIELCLLVIILVIIIIVSYVISIIRKLKKNCSDKLTWVRMIALMLLLILTLNIDHVDSVIESLDWHILYPVRIHIIEQVKRGVLNPNGPNDNRCDLPFGYPQVSVSENEILIFRNVSNKALTVRFYVSQLSIGGSGNYLVYTEDSNEIEKIESLIQSDPKWNWKIKDNWYRTSESELY